MALTQTLSRQIDDAPDTLALEVTDALASRAAQHLIVRHRLGQRFDIEALDIPHEALASIAAQLEEAGVSHAMADPLVDALRRYIMTNGGSFVRAANAKPVRINMVVADRMPKARFDQAVTELACLGAREVKVEGATRVNVRATPSGTSTSSNAADVDAMFANVRGLYLWIRFEAPTKEELDGMMSTVEAALAGAAQSMGGGMGAGELKKLLETLQKDGVLTPAIEGVINTLIKIQNGLGRDGAAKLPAAAMDALVKELGALMDKAQAQGMMPPALLNAVTASLVAAAPDHPSVAAFVAEKGFVDPLAGNDNITAAQRLETLIEKIEALKATDGIDPARIAQLTEIVDKAKADLTSGDVPAVAVLEALGAQLGEMAARGDVPQALADGIAAVMPEIAALRDAPELAQGPAADPAQGEALLAVIEEIAAKIEKGEIDIKDVPPELQALMEKMGGVETILQKEGREARIQVLAEAIVGQGEPALAEAVQNAVLTMADPQAMASLPPEVQQTVQTFIADQPAIVEIAATQTVMREMRTALEGVDPASPAAAEIRQAIETLKTDGLAALIERAPQGVLPPAVLPVVQSFVKDHPAVAVIVATPLASVSAVQIVADIAAATPAQTTVKSDVTTDTPIQSAQVIALPLEAANTSTVTTIAAAPATVSTVSAPAVVSTSATAPADGTDAKAGAAPVTADAITRAAPLTVTPDGSTPAQNPAAVTKAQDTVRHNTTTVTVDIVDMAVSLRALSNVVSIRTVADIPVPAADKAAHVHLSKASDILRTAKAGEPLPVVKAKEVLQNLVDAKSKATSPAVQAQIEKSIRQIETARTDDGKPVTRPDATPKPGCHPICNCLDKGKIEAQVRADPKQSVVAKVTDEGVVLKDGRTVTFKELEVSAAKDKQAWDTVTRVEKTATAFAASDLADLVKDLKNSGACDCGQDHGTGGGSGTLGAFGGAAAKKSITDGAVKITGTNMLDASKMKTSTSTATFAASFGIK